MKIKKSFKIFKEPYASEEKFWIVDIIEGDIYKLNKEIFEEIKNIEKDNKYCPKKEVIIELNKIGVIEDD